jgi:prepilin-type N-terminal cleavage/methylation domain-containing protein
MKTVKNKLPVENKLARTISTKNSKFKTQNFSAAFTLIELLTVIAIIGVLAALLLPLAAAVKRTSMIQHAQTERDLIETAIDRYKSAYGFYPPDNTNSANILSSSLTNQLYYELLGTVADQAADTYTNLDNSGTILSTLVSSTFGVGGFMNCTKSGSGEDSAVARNFLPGLKAAQIAKNGAAVNVLVTSINADATYQPMLGFTTLAGFPANPWRYVSPGINNPSSYDLWIQLEIGGKTNLICNWSSKPLINTPLP